MRDFVLQYSGAPRCRERLCAVKALVAFGMLLFTAGMLHAAEPGTTTEQHIEQVSREAKQVLANFEIRSVDASPISFHRHPEPVLRWSNPTAGEVYGDIFVYTQVGRPMCMISYYRWFTPNWGSTLEVHSLSPQPIVGRSQNKPFWTPKSGGVTYKMLPDVERPAVNPAARLVQMRRIVDAFQVQLIDTRANDGGVKRTLRRLTQPVYRFPRPEANADYLDGAIFAFVEGTDPELLLLMDAVTDRDQSVWRFAIARMNRDQITVTHRDKQVWDAPYLSDLMDRPQEIYTAFTASSGLKLPR